jgi:ribosomal protein S18 acetylase RimI-like enzyme
MNKPNLTIRKATLNDVRPIAYAVGNAIGEEVMPMYCGDSWMNTITEVASLENSQYSYRNALIAEINGSVAGVIVAYDGAKLEELRSETIKIIHKYKPDFTVSEDETEVGEYYIDTLCVLPEYRNMGIATQLIAAVHEKSIAEGHRKLGLIVDFDNPNAERLYNKLGFKRVGIRIFAGHKMWHLVNKK